MQINLIYLCKFFSKKIELNKQTSENIIKERSITNKHEYAGDFPRWIKQNIGGRKSRSKKRHISNQ